MTIVDRFSGVRGALAWKAPVRAATTTNITLFGEQSIDGVSLAAGDRVLVKDQTEPSENGVYVVSTGDWARAKDFNGAGDAVEGTQVYVHTGADNANTSWSVLTAGGFVIGTDAITFKQTFVESPTGLIAFGASENFSPGEVLPAFLAVTNMAFQAGLPFSLAQADVAPAAQAIFSIRKNWVSLASPGEEVATVTFAALSTTGTFAAASDFALAPGDTVRPVAPSPADGALAGVSITLLATG